LNDSVTALFAGPDDKNTCDEGGPDDSGCDGAVNGGPYTFANVPLPGSFRCQVNCRHFVQLDGDAPDGVETIDWSSNLGFAYLGEGDDEEEADEEESPTLATAAAVGILADEAAEDEETQAIPELDSGELGEEQPDLKDVLEENPGDPDSALAYIEEYGVDDALSQVEDGFADSDVENAQTLADALGQDDGDANWRVELRDDGRWYVVNDDTATMDESETVQESMREVGTASSGNHNHAGRPGHVGGSGPAPAGFHKIDFTHDRLVQHIEAIIKEATPDQRERGLHWYDEAHKTANDLAKKYKLTIQKTAGVIAALSPSNAWERNVTDAEKVLATGARPGLKSNYSKAMRILGGEDPETVLMGTKRDYIKTLNFYRNIVDPNSNDNITIDRHAASLALGKQVFDQDIGKVISYADYDTFKDAYRDAGKDLHMSAHEAQAIAWTVWRENYIAHKPRAAMNARAALQEARLPDVPDWLQPAEGEEGFDQDADGHDPMSDLKETLRIVGGKLKLREGGPGSGDKGHAGRPGSVGGSAGGGAATATAEAPKEAPKEAPGAEGFAGAVAPWDMKADAPPRYPGDDSIFSPAIKDASGQYALGRRLQGSQTGKDEKDQVAMYEFIPGSASQEQLSSLEGIIKDHSDHAQLHPGEIAYNDANGNLQRVAGNNYWIRGDYRDLQTLDSALTPKVAAAFGAKNAWSNMMATETPGGTKISAGEPTTHLRVVVPFAKDTPANTVGTPILDDASRTQILSVMSGSAQRRVWQHADFNGIHIATNVPSSEVESYKTSIRSLGGQEDKEEHHDQSSKGATRFIPSDVNIEDYPVRAMHEAIRFETTPFDHRNKLRIVSRFLEVGTASSGDHSHAGLPGHRGGSAKSGAAVDPHSYDVSAKIELPVNKEGVKEILLEHADDIGGVAVAKMLGDVVVKYSGMGQGSSVYHAELDKMNAMNDSGKVAAWNTAVARSQALFAADYPKGTTMYRDVSSIKPFHPDQGSHIPDIANKLVGAVIPGGKLMPVSNDKSFAGIFTFKAEQSAELTFDGVTSKDIALYPKAEPFAVDKEEVIMNGKSDWKVASNEFDQDSGNYRITLRHAT
jgi:hypothetical protein